jgi:hypothetical protein
MTTEYLAVKKNYYESKRNYFNNIGFDTLAADFQGIVDLIGEMETYIKEKENGKD